MVRPCPTRWGETGLGRTSDFAEDGRGTFGYATDPAEEATEKCEHDRSPVFMTTIL